MGQDRGQDAVRQLAQLGVGLLGLIERLGDERRPTRSPSVCARLRELERDDRVHEALLCPVVQIAHDAAASVVAGREQTGTRGDQLGAAVGVGDRRGHELGEVGQALLGVGGSARPREDTTTTPQGRPSTTIGARPTC